MRIKAQHLSLETSSRAGQAASFSGRLGAHACTQHACVRVQKWRRLSGTAASMLETEVGALRKQSLNLRSRARQGKALSGCLGARAVFEGV